MKRNDDHRKRKCVLPCLILIVLVLACLFFVYVRRSYRAEGAALAALDTDDTVSVSRTDYGWCFDGPSEDSVLVFYPGAKVDETAYAPMLRLLAERGMDVCLVRMPFGLAFFDSSAAGAVLDDLPYGHRFVGGHSLGGAMAAVWAAGHGDEIDGLILFAAYPTRDLNDDLLEVSLYGSEDGILNRKKLAAGRAFSPEHTEEIVIEGGNHAGFGNYGAQKGDGTSRISTQEQQAQAVEAILTALADE